MKLISMTDFVLEQEDEWYHKRYLKAESYANFIKQPLKLEMFVPCDENSLVITLPNACICTDLCRLCKKYQKAKEKVLFEGFNWDVAEFCDEPMLLLEDQNGNYFCYDCEDKTFNKNDEIWYLTIEGLTRFDLTLTKSAIKKLGL
jgi:hypothetical protein